MTDQQTTTHTLSLADQKWLQAEPLQRLLALLNGGEGEARVAGGAVRNALMGEEIADVDIATTLTPQQVSETTKRAGMGVAETGIEHGTVTVIIHDDDGTHTYEVTTLRIDEETDGRHAKVAFTDDWVGDASRRDFTINAIYCNADGSLFDPLNGHDDIVSRTVRFVGSAHDRAREDYLRILRFFRFHARYAEGVMDDEALQACMDLKDHLAELSGERIHVELFKLLVARGAVETVGVMVEHGILQAAFPCEPRLNNLSRMHETDVANGLEADGELRFGALCDPQTSPLDRLRLSNAQTERLLALPPTEALQPDLTAQERRAALYRMGRDRYLDAVRYCWASSTASATDDGWRSLLLLADEWPVPAFPVRGKDLIGLGIAPGRELGDVLRSLEARWIDEDFAADKAVILTWVEA